MCHLLRPVPGARHVGLHAPLLQTLHLPLLEGNPGARQLPAVPQGVQLQAVPDQLPCGGHGGEDQGLHVGHTHQERGGEFMPPRTRILLAAFHALSFGHLGGRHSVSAILCKQHLVPK